MTRRKWFSIPTVAAAIAIVALVVAGCGGDDDQATAASGAQNPSGGEAATIGVTDSGGLGKILVDSQGRTVYLFKKDTGPTSTCAGACAVEWPPVTTKGKPTVAGGLMASMVGTTSRSDGKTQVTYNGHPLYLFEGDQKPGDTAGQNVDAFGAEWYVISPAGDQVSGKASSSGGGYGY